MNGTKILNAAAASEQYQTIFIVINVISIDKL